ncbi:YbbR domain-containing protein [Lachnospiraceae bacterium XBB1006]|nr:YbbR domain-containing protein [Lachnospiraceae bacterium XBB1006]
MARKLVKMVTNNFILKLIAVLLAVVLWLVVVNIDNPQTTMTFTSTANIINESIITDNGKVYEVLDNSNTIKFSVTGPRTIVEGMSASDFSVVADMNKIDLDLGLVPVEVVADRYASKVSVSLKTTNVRVSIENVKSQQFAVNATASGTPMEGYALGNVSCEPATVTISGPESVIKSIDKVSAGINVDGMYSNRTQTVVPTLYNSNGKKIVSANVTIEPSTVQVLAQIMGTKSIPVTYEYTGEIKEGYELESVKCLPDTIEVKGSKEALSEIEELRIPSNALNLSKSVDNVEKSVSITGLLPKGVELVDADNTNVIIKAEIVAHAVRKIVVDAKKIVIENLESGYDIDFIQKSVTVTISGEKAALEKIKESDIVLSMDMDGVHTGRFNKTPVCEEMDGVTEIKVTSILGRVIKAEGEPNSDEEE